MKNQFRLSFSKLLLIPIVITFLAGCGGGSSNAETESNDTSRPVYLERELSIVPSATPTGDITETTPTFTWNAIPNATDYQYGHENLDTRAWRSYTLSAEDSNCSNIGDTCSDTPTDFVFSEGQRSAWWVRAKINGIWQEWSDPHVFTIIIQNPTVIGVPNAIGPTGDISDTTPEFSWSSVAGISDYQLGHEDLDTRNWQSYIVSKAQAGCLAVNQTCSFTPSNLTFAVDQRIAWWVRARVNGTYGEWSEVAVITIIPETTQTNVKINEVLAVNSRTNLDPDFSQFSDWIELYNPTSQNINISNYGLSDDDDPLQWKFPTGTIIQANSYLLVWADGEDIEDKALHANFKLSSKGENLTLADSNGIIIDNIDFDKQESDVSATKQLNDIVFMAPTPGSQNGTTQATKDLSKAPQFTFDSGFFNSPIAVAMSQENGADIYFTTDGSTPNSGSQKYTQAINVNQTTVIRAIGIEAGGLPSKIISNSYFINHTSTLPVVSLTTDPDYLFDPKIGIYTDGDGSNGVPLLQCDPNYTDPFNYAQEWERPSHLEYFGNNQVSEFSLTSGISISGQCSRKNQKKSLSFELDSKYGTKELEYKLFESKNVQEFKDFKLRTGQFGYQLSDVIGAALVDTGNLNIDYQAYRTTQMFVNGEYWGVYNFREKKGADFIVSNYPDIDKDELDIINQGFEAKTGDTDDYYALEILLQSTLNLDLSNDADYQNILGMIDESNYIDYMALMIYSANTDWIGSNQRSWKEKKAGAKWRWMVDDLDSGFYRYSANINQFTNVLQSDSTDVLVSLFIALTKNSTFNQKFKSRLNTLLDTTFSPANMLNQIDTIVDQRYPYIPLENAKWDSIDTDSFDRHVENLKVFANTRSAIVRDQLNSFLP